ncbi:U-box domain-containing protein 35-like isoform X3 [Vitis riparia]|uniref:U-box domain-containing protein 35-like isoform X3 n=1 Tax=Vitis riparia TaxID=96939 RepID=UPI00155B2B95|nr:U-box domain-containing protein 35-like isoform X3 [Vitis riparia]
MEAKEIIEEKQELALALPLPSTIAVAINGKKKSKYVVRWALEKFVPEGLHMFKMLHVRPKITSVPTPMGNSIPLSQVRDDVAAAYLEEMGWQTSEMLLPYKTMFLHKKVQVDVVVIESDDVAKAIAEEIAKALSISLLLELHLVACFQGSAASYSHFHSPSLPMQRFQALSTINRTLLHTRTGSIETNSSRRQSLDIREEESFMSPCPSNSDIGYAPSQVSSARSFLTDDQSWISDQASTSDAFTESSSGSQVNINFELEKLRVELRHVRGIYAMAQSENIDAARKLNDLSKRRLEEADKLKEIKLKEEEARELARKEKEKYEAAKREAEYARECAEKEALQRKEAEIKALHDVKEKEKLENALVGPVQSYQEFTWEEIVSATSSFSENLQIGKGAHGTVYRCNLHHTTAAVKVLHSKEGHITKEFQQELDVLSKIRHPHLLLLLGACSDHGCLVYEYMENGSLEERLLQKYNTAPIPWFERYRIAWEVASTLVFLHNSKPKSIIHRDLKPANILLDHNLVSKIGDVGLSTMLNLDSSICNINTGPVGTLCYIDPEYQRTGLVSPKSDVYAFGMVVLQLLTAKPAIALAHLVETAVQDDQLMEILDPMAGQWPMKETKELALLGLGCLELRRRDRPDLKDEVLPALERLKDVADRSRDSAPKVQLAPPNHFVCPILKDVMHDPCVAADGYTYDRRAIEKWVEENDNSPMTNLALPNKNLIPNYTLLSAIMEWKSQSNQ